jgi:DNA helicase-2/ATP-dependent DNA helicase PcrA
MGTFHSIFARILRTEGGRLGYQPNYTIYDTTDSKSLIRTIIKELGLDDNVYKAGVIAARISAAKNNLITSGMYAADSSLQEYDKSCRMPLITDVYRTYSTRCFRSNAMDFDDLLLNINILLRDFPDVLASYQQKFSYILVDEYQDTNLAQYLIIKKLAAQHENICVVGDDAQSIYSFRGARIENILRFTNDYPSSRLFKLEQNYRSTRTIVNAANEIIANNEGQIQKTVFSKNEEGDRIMVMQAMTDMEEGFNIASDIFDKRLTYRLKWEEFAILYRTNAQSRIFEETLRRKNIPYKIYGGLSFYERREIKDILAYFRMVINPGDEEAFKRSVNYPRRGIGGVTIRKILDLSAGMNATAWDIISDTGTLQANFNTGTVSKLSGYSTLISSFFPESEKPDAYSLAREIAYGSGIMKELRDGKMPEEISRYENMEELLNGIKAFTEAAVTNGEPSSLAAYLANVALLTDQDNEKEEDREKITLMTMHSAKGLEFNYVYIAGMEDTLFPSPMSSGSAKELEEERRLFYVAVTRAKKQVVLSYALNRYKWGNLEKSNPSRFLQEIDKKYIHYPQTGGKPFRSEGKPFPGGEKSFTGGEKPFRTGIPSSRLKKFRTTGGRGAAALPGAEWPSRSSHVPDPPAPASSARSSSATGSRIPYSSGSGNAGTQEFNKGDAVIHERFGPGIIVSLEGEAPDNTASVDFEKSGRKKLLLRFAKLRKI